MNAINAYKHRQLMEQLQEKCSDGLQNEVTELQRIYDRYQMELLRLRDLVDEYEIQQRNIRINLRRLQMKEKR